MGAIALLLATEIGFIWGRGSLVSLAVLVLAFFIAFNILEATLPSLVSRLAPAHQRGLALGVYNTTQALGLFAGGGVGGWILQNHGGDAVFVCCALLALAWLALAAGMVPPAVHRQQPAG